MEFSFFYDTVLWRTGRSEAFERVRENWFVLVFSFCLGSAMPLQSRAWVPLTEVKGVRAESRCACICVSLARGLSFPPSLSGLMGTVVTEP